MTDPQTTPERGETPPRPTDVAEPHAHHLLDYAIETPAGALRGQLALRVGRQMGLAELAFNMLPLGQKLVEMGAAASVAAGRPISCARGCGACCRQLVPLSPPEALMMADMIAGTRPPRREHIEDRFAQSALRLEEAGLTERLLATPEDDAAALALADEYFRLAMPCPFLEDEACSVHPYRPSACREYLVTSPAEWCSRPRERAIARVAAPVCLSRALARLTGELLDAPPRLIPLALAPQWASANPELARRRWDARATIERLFSLLRHA